MNLNITRYFDISESSSDDEIVAEYVLMRRPKVFRPRNPPLGHWDEVDFCQRYRLSKESVIWIIRNIGDELKRPTERNYAVTPMEQLLLTLRFYATGNMQQCSGDLSGVSKSTACKIIHAVSRHICLKLKYFIAMPQTAAELRDVVESFFNIAKFPSVVVPSVVRRFKTKN
ncbi:unnamed protein product [Euphydryas editha]|uniref:Nuclease HARBI1 n=1 Tax=Euphydryas editha TaxID=104508 RepID=A0AAU9TX27_EUPED|nr:unnamed protein product [Euphydryas editha]